MIATDANIHDYLSDLAEELNGLYMEYTNDSGAMNLKVANGRNQSVKSFSKSHPTGDTIVFMSKVCYLEEYPEVDFQQMLEKNHELLFTKLVIDRGYLETQAAIRLASSSKEEMLFVINEVARVADDLENEITGLDVY
jgi:hypothetical protein